MVAFGVLAMVDDRAAEGVRRRRIGKGGDDVGGGQVWELRLEGGAALAHLLGDLRLVVGEIKERGRGRELLALKEHRRAGDEQEQGGESLEAPEAGQAIEAQARPRVGDLIVVLQE